MRWLLVPAHSVLWMGGWRRNTQPLLPPLQQRVSHQKHEEGLFRHLVTKSRNCSYLIKPVNTSSTQRNTPRLCAHLAPSGGGSWVVQQTLNGRF